VCIVSIRHGIEAALGERAAASEALEGQQAAAASAVASDSFRRVIRAGGIKLAGASQERREKNLIQTDEREQEPRAERQSEQRRWAAL
jgi:hypothetical protein